MTLTGYDKSEFSHDGVCKTIYRKGRGPAVVLIHEVPGITPEALELAERLIAAGFLVVLPSLFGSDGKPLSNGYAAQQMFRLCIGKEVSMLAANASSPITTWLRGLCKVLHAELGGRGVGVIGMCLTGNFVLSTMVEPSVVAPVVAQPALPLPVGAKRAASLHLSDDELVAIQSRTKQEGLQVLGLRFSGDSKCPASRFATLREALGPGFVPIEIDSSPGNAHGISPAAHSVLTHDFVDREGHPTKEALGAVLSFLGSRLQPES